MEPQVDSEFNKAKKYAFNILSHRPYSHYELEKRLEKKGFQEEVVEDVIALMLKYGYLNDEEYAHSYIDVRRRRGIGKKRLHHELLNKGIEREIANRALDSISNEMELSLAKKMIQRRIGNFKKVEEKQIEYRRQAQFLYRKGFSPEIITQVLAEELIFG